MSFVCFVIYLFLTYVRPYELFPSLVPLRLMMVFGTISVMVTTASIPFSGIGLRPKQLPLLAGFAMWVSFSLLVALHWIGGALQALTTMSINLIVFFVAVYSVNTQKRLRWALKLVVGFSILLVFQSFLALHFGVFRDLLVLEETLSTGGMVERVRGTGFMRDPNDLAEALVMAFPFAALGWRRRGLIQNLFAVGIPTAILLYGVYMTHSRGAIVSLIVILFIALRSRLGSVLSGFATVAGVLVMVATMAGGRGFNMDRSAMNRVEAWSKGLQLLKQHPISGVGFGMFTDFHDITAHNSFVLCFSELGLPGYFLWLSLLLVTGLELNALRKLPVKTDDDAQLQRLARSIQLAFYGFLVSAWFLSRTYNVTLYLLIALSIAVVGIARRSGKVIGPFTFPFIVTRTSAILALSLVLIYLQVKLQVR